jgi:hypothetical protein
MINPIFNFKLISFEIKKLTQKITIAPACIIPPKNNDLEIVLPRFIDQQKTPRAKPDLECPESVKKNIKGSISR